MSKNKLITALVLLTVLLTNSLSAQHQLLSFDDLTNFLSEEDKQSLISNGEVTALHFEPFSPTLLPPVQQEPIISREVRAGELNMGIEGLFLYKDFDYEAYQADPEAGALKLYNTIKSISTLQGIEYYSASSERMKTLFVESWIIPDLDSPKEKLEDPIVDTIPASEKLYLHQKDKSFGNNENEMSFTYDDGAISALILNKTNMYYKGLIKAIGPDKMQIHLVIMPTEEGLLFYGTMAADTLNLKAFREKASNSFYNRVIALYSWYTSEIEK